MVREGSRTGRWGGRRTARVRLWKRLRIVCIGLFSEVSQLEQHRAGGQQGDRGSCPLQTIAIIKEKEIGGTQQQTPHLWPQKRRTEQHLLRRRKDRLPQKRRGVYLYQSEEPSWRKIKLSIGMISFQFAFQTIYLNYPSYTHISAFAKPDTVKPFSDLKHRSIISLLVLSRVEINVRFVWSICNLMHFINKMLIK